MSRLVASLAVVILVLFAADDAGAHPEIVLLDADGRDVLESRAPVSAFRTCGECHDAKYIAEHSYHSAVGFDERFEPGSVAAARPWSFSPGMFGRWDPLRYQRLTIPGEAAFDLGVADWIRAFGDRHVGGGPAYYARSGAPLTALEAGDDVDPETHVFDPATGEPAPWDWQRSGAVEMNCFLCHVAEPADAKRVEALKAGRFGWATTATLANSGLVEASADGTWAYVDERFGDGGVVTADRLAIREPTSSNCGLCHASVHDGPEPVELQMGLQYWDTESKGQIYAAAKVRDSTLNLTGKAERCWPWDVHAARLLECTNCHPSVNNPVAFAEADRSRPAHLAYDARRPTLSEFLNRPSHNFAKGESAQGTVARRLDGTMRRCEDCHHGVATHEKWLPYTERHLQTLLCETCHVPHTSAPARQFCDWTVLDADGAPRVHHRGVEGPLGDSASLITGFEPVILPRHQRDGRIRHGPHNLCTGWYWVGGEPERPIRIDVLKRAYFEAGAYRPEVVAALDEDGDGALAPDELRLDTRAKVVAIASRLEAEGVASPRIQGCIQPLSLHHGVVPGAFATRRCETCHARDSRMTRPFEVASYVPGGVLPSPAADSNTRMPGRLYRAEDGRLLYQPTPTASGRYVIGYDRAGWIDVVGLAAVGGAILLVMLHALLRGRFARRRAKEAS